MSDFGELRVQRIVVGVDGSASSLDALRRAAAIATHFDATVEAIGAWQISAVVSPYFPAQQWSVESDVREMLQEAVATVFGDTLPGWLRAGVRQGPASRVLIDASTEADLLVVGSRGHGGVVGLLLGSVSAACAEGARCPVLIVHERK
jgi:nucleotide-binding universal stress UspA family protein